MLNLHLLLVNITRFLIRPLVHFSFDFENGSRRKISFCSSNSGIIKPSVSLLKCSIAFLIKFLGKPADNNFLVMHFTSKLKLLTILFSVAKAHKFEPVEEIYLDSLKLCPIIDQRGTYIYNNSKLVAEYLRI